MVTIGAEEIVYGLKEANFIWLLIPIFIIGIVTDKYQESNGTSIGNAISNGTLIIFTGFSWLQVISSRYNFPLDIEASQYLFSFLIILYGFIIIASGFFTGEFARVYGRIRVVTFMLMFFTLMIHVPLFYNFVSVLIFVLIFPVYYVLISELIKFLPSTKKEVKIEKNYRKRYENDKRKGFITFGRAKLKEYLD